jgi:RNA polymerase sigma-70 factor (ECF subfamily)
MEAMMEEHTKTRLIEEIYTHRRLVYSICMKVLWRYDMQNYAEDATQEILSKAPRKVDSFREGCDLKTWLYRLTTNHCIDIIRKEQRRPQRSVGIEAMVAAQEDETGCATLYQPYFTGNPELTYVQRIWLRSVLRKTMREIAPDRQRVFFLYLEGWSYQEISSTLGVPPGTVRSQLHRVREELKLALG